MRPLPSLILVFALLLAACSGASGETTTTVLEPTTRVTTTTTTTAPTTTVPPTTTTTLAEAAILLTRVSDEEGLEGSGDQMLYAVEWTDFGILAVGPDYGMGASIAWVMAADGSWSAWPFSFDGVAQGLLFVEEQRAMAVGYSVAGADEDAAVWNLFAGGMGFSNVFPALGGAGDQVMTSLAAFGGSADEPGVVAAGVEYLADDTNGVIWLSPDNTAWTRVDADALGGPGAQRINGVAAAGPGLVAVGQEDEVLPWRSPVIWVSPDGLDWTRISTESLGTDAGMVTAVVAGGPGVVAVGFAPNPDSGSLDAAVWVSADGADWTQVEDEDLGGIGEQMMLSVTRAGGWLVAAGQGGSEADPDAAVWISADGLDWQRVAHDETVFGGDGVQRIFAMSPYGSDGSGLVAVGYDESGGDADAAIWIGTITLEPPNG